MKAASPGNRWALRARSPASGWTGRYLDQVFRVNVRGRMTRQAGNSPASMRE